MQVDNLRFKKQRRTKFYVGANWRFIANREVKVKDLQQYRLKIHVSEGQIFKVKVDVD